MGEVLLWLGYVGVALTLLGSGLFIRSWMNMTGRHFGAAAAFPFVIAAVVTSVVAIVMLALHLIFGWRWPMQAYGVFPTGLLLLSPFALFGFRFWKRR